MSVMSYELIMERGGAIGKGGNVQFDLRLPHERHQGIGESMI